MASQQGRPKTQNKKPRGPVKRRNGTARRESKPQVCRRKCANGQYAASDFSESRYFSADSQGMVANTGQ